MARDRQRLTIGKSQDFPVGEMRLMELKGRQIGVIRLRCGELRAIMNRCPHKGAPICRGILGGVWNWTRSGELTFGRAREVLVCPWHGFEFDLASGQEVYWKRPARLRTYPIEDVDGVVLLEL